MGYYTIKMYNNKYKNKLNVNRESIFFHIMLKSIIVTADFYRILACPETLMQQFFKTIFPRVIRET